VNRFIKDWEPGSMPDGSDPPRVTPAAKIAIGVSIVIIVGAVILMATGAIGR
jgi:hypothetical protein